MIAIGNNKIANNVISLDPNLFEGNIGYFKIAEVPQHSEEGNQYSILDMYSQTRMECLPQNILVVITITYLIFTGI